MSQAGDCSCACPTPTVTAIPGAPGADGAAGAAGTNGINSFTFTSADFVVPAIGSNVTFNVGNSAMFTTGQNIFVTTAGTFEIISFPSATSIEAEYLNYSGNTNTGNTITAGAQVVSTGTEPTIPTPTAVADGGTGSTTATAARAALGIGGANLAVYASGTSYQLTATPALLNFGTTDPQLTISSAGTWLILARARLDYNGATFAAVRTATLKVRRTNNTPADIANTSAGVLTDIITTLTYTLAIVGLQPIIYVTTNANDVLELWGSVSVVPSAGSLDASEASIVAIKLFDQTI